jgi:hypothetical protein
VHFVIINKLMIDGEVIGKFYLITFTYNTPVQPKVLKIIFIAFSESRTLMRRARLAADVAGVAVVTVIVAL